MKISHIRQRKPGQPTILVSSNASGIGDALLKMPMLMALRQLFPSHHITFMTNHASPFHLNLLPLVITTCDTIISELKIVDRTLKAYLNQPYKQLTALSNGYTMIIDTDTHVKSTLMLKTIPHKLFITAAAKFWLSSRRPHKGYQRPLHIAQRQYDLACMAAQQPIQPIKYTPPTALLAHYYQISSTCLPAGPRYIGFAPGAGHPTRPKKWPLERFIAVAQQQTQLGRVPVFFLGPEEASWQAGISHRLPNALFPETHPCAQQDKGPCLVIALAHQLHLAVCNDNGIAHMIATANTPVLGLFGPTNADKFSPLSTHSKVLRAQNWGTDRMESIPVAAVNQAIEGMFAAARLRHPA